jgi:bla regulator protein blaR1
MSQAFSLQMSILLQSIGWALMHSIWQAALIWLLIKAIFKLFPSWQPRLKYGIALMGLGTLCMWVINTAVTQWREYQTVVVKVIGGTSAEAMAYSVPISTQTTGMANGLLPLQLHAWMPWLMVAYGLGLMLMLLRMGAGLRQLQRLRASGTDPVDAGLDQLLESLRLQLGMTREVLLRFSSHVAVPIVIGALRPMILLPASMVEDLGTEGLRAILLHELAHISRGDYLINLLQSLVECLLFFNPFAWAISGILRQEREHCCDDLVVAETGQAVAYASALARLAEIRPCQVSNIVLAATGPGKQDLLFNRIKRIVEMKTQPVRTVQTVAVCSIVAIIVAISIACFSPSYAQKGKKQKEEPAAQKEEKPLIKKSTRIVFIDSNGKKREYTNVDQLPPAEKKKLEAELEALDDTLAAIRKIGPQISEGLANLHETISKDVSQTITTAMASVDWNEIEKQVEGAMKEVEAVDWKQIEREVAIGLAEADKALSDPKLRVQIRREMAEARNDVATARTRYYRDHEKNREEARRELARARRDMERARRELEAARENERAARRELQRDRSTAED